LPREGKGLNLSLRVDKSVVRTYNVPRTTWTELEPFWPDIAKSILEVHLSGHFDPRHFTKENPEGFYAGEYYWRKSETESRTYRLAEAKRFIELLLKNELFVRTVRQFNQGRTDWLAQGNSPRLRQFVYSCCHQLEPFLLILAEKRFSNPAKSK
jgi:hypothetical protein